MKKKRSLEAAPLTDAPARNRSVAVAQEQPSVTPEMREILNALLALKAGDFSVRLPGDWTGVHGKIADAFNDITSLTDKSGHETARVSQAVGKKGRLKQRVNVPGATGGRSEVNANRRTDELLKQSQEITAQLQTRQSELQNTHQALVDKARQLADQNAEVEQARHALEQKAAELALTSKYKSEFLANMSHELRTPLNSILILSQQLTINAGGNLTEKQVEWARNVHSAGSELLNLINDILDLSKIESGTVSVDAEEITFGSIHDTIERNFRHVAESRTLPFMLDLDPNLPAKLTVDSKRLQQILKNLLSNAFKFTHHGHVAARIFLPSSGWNPTHPILGRTSQIVAFEVTDTGIGIAPDKQRLIFEAFQQADASTSRKYGGTGLGLAISRELSALLGGEIRLVSMPNQGSTFTLFLPLHYAGPALDPLNPQPTASDNQATHTAHPMPAPTPGKIEDNRDALEPGDRSLPREKQEIIDRLHRSNDILRGRKVLIVDDDARTIYALASALEGESMEFLSATNGRQAIQTIHNTPDLAMVLMDIMMPEMDGFETMAEIRKHSQYHALPILAVTAKAMKGDREKCLEAGASDYLAKPINTEHLLSLLRIWLYR